MEQLKPWRGRLAGWQLQPLYGVRKMPPGRAATTGHIAGKIFTADLLKQQGQCGKVIA